MKNFLDIADRHKYSLLLLGLMQHLYIGIVLPDLDLYLNIVWPINMVVLGLASVVLFLDTQRWKRWTRNILLVLVICFPIS